MQNNYKILFSVRVLHSYFENNICTCLGFVPLGITEKITEKPDFKIRNNKNGFDVFCSSNNRIEDIFNYIQRKTDQDYLEFGITSSTANFVFLTQLPADKIVQLHYSSQDPLNSSNENAVVLNTTLSEQKTSTATGNLKLYFKDLLAMLEKYDSVNYTISLTARATQWQYYIINRNAVPLNNPSISGKTPVNFKGPENVVLDNGQQALLFYTDENELPLSQVPAYRFDLVNAAAGKKSATPKIIFKGLPNPDPSKMGTVLINGKNRLTSPMYIYL